ncbi:hypothetical protein MASR2M78_05220 [Treponema sp.]
MEYFFIGEAELATAFRFVGISGISVSSTAEAQSAFRRLTRSWVEGAEAVLPGAEGCRVLILTEDVADSLGDELSEWQLSGQFPLVVEVPPLMGKLAGRKTLVDSIRDAIGIRV